MTILTADQVAVAMGVDGFTTDETDLVELYIESAIAEIEAYLGRPVGAETFTENLWPDANGAVYFSQTPVISVSSIIVNGTAQDVDYYTVTKYGLENVFSRVYTITSFSVDEIHHEGIYGPQITVTYCAGLNNPALVRGIILAAVVKKMQGRSINSALDEVGAMGVRRIKVEEFETEYATTAPGSRSTGASNFSMFESEFDLRLIKRYKRRSFG